MLEKSKKVLRMQNELLKYLIIKKAKKVESIYEEKENFYEVTLSAKLNMSEKEIEFLISKFSKNKEREYEYFWELMGESLEEDELELLFTLADDVRIYYENNILKFVLVIEK